jgi:hypothetical protein
MLNAGQADRERFIDRMRAVAVGAKLRRGRAEWLVVKAKRRETTIDLTLRSGRRELVVPVGVSHWGPDLGMAGLRPVASAPEQRELIGGTA